MSNPVSVARAGNAAWCALLAAAIVGCETEPPTPVVLTPLPAPPAAAPAPQPAAAPAPVAQAPAPNSPVAPAPVATPSAPVPQVAEAPAPSAPVADAASEEMDRKKAQAGVGIKGRDIPNQLGTTAIKQYFRIPEKTVFEIQIPSALNLYTAEKGHGPKTHDEFMEQIIKANQIALPQLPPGERYLWDPEKQELLVEHPKR